MFVVDGDDIVEVIVALVVVGTVDVLFEAA